MTKSEKVAASCGILAGGVGFLPPGVEWLGLESELMEIRIVPPLLRLYFGLLPLTLLASLTGALGSLVLLADRGQSGAFWVLLSSIFAVAGAGASGWWVIEGLSGLGSLGGL